MKTIKWLFNAIMWHITGNADKYQCHSVHSWQDNTWHDNHNGIEGAYCCKAMGHNGGHSIGRHAK